MMDKLSQDKLNPVALHYLKLPTDNLFKLTPASSNLVAERTGDSGGEAPD
jgi:hypothetical protein